MLAGIASNLAIAIAFAKAGADIALASRKMPDLEVVSDEISKIGVKAFPVSINTGKTEEVIEGVSKVLNFFGGDFHNPRLNTHLRLQIFEIRIIIDIF